MGSGVNSSAQGKYVGNDGTTEVKPGFKPKYVRIESANGSAEFWASKAKVSKRIVAGDLTFITGLELTEFGFKVTGTDVVLNANAVEYEYSLY